MCSARGEHHRAVLCPGWNRSHSACRASGQRQTWPQRPMTRYASELLSPSAKGGRIDVRSFCYAYVPKPRSETEIANGIPVTYVPARNTIFLAYALGWAEVIQAADIFLGVNAIDYSGYPDCRPEFIEAFQTVANVGTKAGVEGGRFQIHTPLIKFSKAEIIRKAVGLGDDLWLTDSR